nr:hypothetical protein [uncultured Devosia sp.]
MNKEFVLPFPGFYHSWLEDLIDEAFSSFLPSGSSEEEREHHLGDLIDHCDFEGMMYELAGDYARSLVGLCERCGVGSLSMSLAFVDAPREPGSIVRIFATIAPGSIESLFAVSAAEAHRSLSAMLVDENTSSGPFYSPYSPELADHLKAPVDQWDHNQLTWLLRAALEAKGLSIGDVENEVESEFKKTGAVPTAVAKSIDWGKVWTGAAA